MTLLGESVSSSNGLAFFAIANSITSATTTSFYIFHRLTSVLNMIPTTETLLAFNFARHSFRPFRSFTLLNIDEYIIVIYGNDTKNRRSGSWFVTRHNRFHHRFQFYVRNCYHFRQTTRFLVNAHLLGSFIRFTARFRRLIPRHVIRYFAIYRAGRTFMPLTNRSMFFAFTQRMAPRFVDNRKRS